MIQEILKYHVHQHIYLTESDKNIYKKTKPSVKITTNQDTLI